jgi:cytochrome c-type biogenesis protein CcmE
MSRNGRKKVGLLSGVGIIGATFAYLIYGGISDNLVYFVSPTELLERGAQAYEVPVRLGGEVKAGTVQWNADQLDLRFELTDGESNVMVFSKGAPPQMFRDGQGVVVEGRLTRGDVFESTNLMVMHSNEYRAPEEGQRPQDLYHPLPRRSEEASRGRSTL